MEGKSRRIINERADKARRELRHAMPSAGRPSAVKVCANATDEKRIFFCLE
jgi:hypothetical protein